MAKTYFKKYHAEFRTAKEQYEIVKDLTVSGKGDAAAGNNAASKDLQVVHVGDLVKISGGALQLVVGTSATSGNVATPTVTTDMYIVAQSDMTMELGHVPVENRDYRYSDVVADTTSKKHVALFPVIYPDDVILTPSAEGDYGA